MVIGALITPDRRAALERLHLAHERLHEALAAEAALYPMLFCIVSAEQREDTARQLAEAQRASLQANRAYRAAVQEVTKMCRLPAPAKGEQVVR